MGNSQFMRPTEKEEDYDEDSEHTKKKNKNNKKVIQIQPYNHDAVDTGFVSPIKGYLPVQQEQVLFVKRPEQLEDQDIVDYVKQLETNFDENSRDKIRSDFVKQSRENIIGKTKFLRFIGIENEVEEDSQKSNYSSDCQFIQIFFKSCLRILDHGQTGEYMDYSKLLKVLNLMRNGQQNEKLEFFFSLFDTNSDGKIERDDLNYFYIIFFDFLLQTPFTENNSSLEKLKSEIQRSKEKDIANAIKKLSDETNQKYCNREGHLTYDNWQQLMKNEYLNDMNHLDDTQLQKSQIHDTSSFMLESNINIPTNLFTNIQKNNYNNQTLPTEPNKREEQQMILKDKKDIFL